MTRLGISPFHVADCLMLKTPAECKTPLGLFHTSPFVPTELAPSSTPYYSVYSDYQGSSQARFINVNIYYTVRERRALVKHFHRAVSV